MKLPPIPISVIGATLAGGGFVVQFCDLLQPVRRTEEAIDPIASRLPVVELTQRTGIPNAGNRPVVRARLRRPRKTDRIDDNCPELF